MIKIGLCGFGKMGKEIHKILIDSHDKFIFSGCFVSHNTLFDLEKLCRESDIIIDFSTASVLPLLLDCAKKTDVKLVVGTTGLSEVDFTAIKRFSKKNSIFYSANMSLGAFLLTKISAKAAKILGEEFDIVITDLHHKLKKDSPSGTALMISEAIKEKTSMINSLQIVSIRSGEHFGSHEIKFSSESEIITFKHQALNREIFAKGAIKAAEFVASKQKGLFLPNDMFKI